MLILAATPIGNLGDASPRLVEHLVGAKFIAAEDTRTVFKLANALGIKINAKLFSLHEHNESDRLVQLVEIAADNDILVVSDAGMPTVSDPGFLLVRAAVAAGIDVSVIPGPSAVLAALAVSGLPTDRFSFEGFVPRKTGDRRKTFEGLSRETRTMIFFESPHRIHESLAAAAEVFGPNRQASVSRELTKKFEQTVRGTLAELTDWAAEEPRGEIVFVVAGAEPEATDTQDLLSLVLELAADGTGLKQAAADIAAAHGVSKNDLYNQALQARGKKG